MVAWLPNKIYKSVCIINNMMSTVVDFLDYKSLIIAEEKVIPKDKGTGSRRFILNLITKKKQTKKTNPVTHPKAPIRTYNNTLR